MKKGTWTLIDVAKFGKRKCDQEVYKECVKVKHNYIIFM